MAYKVKRKDGVRTLFNGRFYPAGATIGPHAMPPSLWQSLINEGVIVADEQAPEPTPQPENPREYDSDLADVVTAEMMPALAGAGVNSVSELLAASEKQLTKLQGVGPATVRKWKEDAK